MKSSAKKLIIGKLRRDRGITQAQLSAAIGVPQSTISYLESRAWNPTVTLLTPIAEYFGVSIEQLYANDNADQTA